VQPSTSELPARVGGLAALPPWKSRRTLSSVGTYLAFGLFLAYTLLPLYWIAISSVTPLSDLFRQPPAALPPHVTGENFVHMVENLPFRSYLVNSIVFSVGSALLAIIVSFLAAYTFARYSFRGRDLLFVVFLLSTALPQISTAIPLFKLYRHLGLVNSLQGLIILMGSLLTPFTIWILTSFIKQVPREIEEAAQIDGAGVMAVLWRVTVPLVLPALAALFLINFVITWNELFYPLVFATSNSVKPLTLGLVELTTSAGGFAQGRPWDLLSALSVVMIVPPIILVTVFRRWFVGGLTQGAVK
jgi:ABC-type glycerol-3-phosphate transport system permease component